VGPAGAKLEIKSNSKMKRQRNSSIPLLDGCEGTTVVFDPDFGTRDFRLFEIPADLEEAVVKEGAELRVLGSKDSLDAVICTGDRTYSIKKVETSNTVCMLPALDSGKEMQDTDSVRVVGVCPIFYELKAATPSFAKVEQALLQTIYRGAEAEAAFPPTQSLLMKRSDVERVALASEAETTAALKALGAIEIGGYVRLLSRDAKWDIAKKLLNEIVLGDLDYSCIDDSDLQKRLQESDPSCDYTLCTSTLATLGSLVDGRWALDKGRMASTAAHLFFRENTKKFHAKDSFLTMWELSLPRNVPADHSALAGVALSVAQNPGEKEEFFTYVPVTEAGETVEARLRFAFAAKSKLSLEELRPYLAIKEGEREGEGENVEGSLLVEYTSSVDGAFIFKTGK
jgi:hypothetical protein